MQQGPMHSPEPQPTDDKSSSLRRRRFWLWLGGLLFALPVALVLGFNGWWAFQLHRAVKDLKQRGEPVTQAEAHALTAGNAPEDHENLAMIPGLLAFQQSEDGRAALRQLELENPAQHELLHCPDLDLHGMARAMDIEARREAQRMRASDPDAEPPPLPCFSPDFRDIRLFAVYAALEQARMRVAHAAIALERHHLRHGRYPTDWSEMIPATFAGPPLDPFTAGKLRLLPVDEGAGRTRPVIYSLGLNRPDNGGDDSAWDLEGEYHGRPPVTGDLVWRYPEPETAGEAE